MTVEETSLQKSIEFIKAYCNKHEDCKKCKLYDSKAYDKWCMIGDKAPMDWEYKAKKKESEEDEM